MKAVIFVCMSCDYNNRVNRGMPNFIEYQTIYDSLTDVYQHMIDYDCNHNIVARIEDENDKS